MRPKSMILIVIVLGCGLVASIGISQVMESRKTEPAPVAPTEKIYVAITDIPLGQALNAQMVKIEEWPQDKVPEGSVKNLEDIEGRRPMTRLYPGEPILAAKLLDANKFWGASEKIPKGLRVVSVKVTMDSSASGLIHPGDRVDVVVFLKAGKGIVTTTTRTILKNITVFAVNERIQRDMEDENDAVRAKTVSLLVKPSQVEKVMLAHELGNIKLSLRRTDDDTEDHATGATIADLNGNSDKGADSMKTALASTTKPNGSGITDFLQGMKSWGHDSAATANEGWVMHIHTPSDIQVFNWDDRETLPRELMSAPPAGAVQPPVVAEPQVNFDDWGVLNETEGSEDEIESDDETSTLMTDTDDATPLLMD